MPPTPPPFLKLWQKDALKKPQTIKDPFFSQLKFRTRKTTIPCQIIIPGLQKTTFFNFSYLQEPLCLLYFKSTYAWRIQNPDKQRRWDVLRKKVKNC